MIDYSAVAVEIWVQILDWVCDAPFVLDTMLDTDRDYWKHSHRYHDVKAYNESERHRLALRRVCRSWKEFADGYKYRWITYNTSPLAAPLEQAEALEAMAQCENRSTLVDDQRKGLHTMSRPRRILFHITTQSDMNVFRTAVDSSLLMKVTTLFVECSEEYDEEVFEYMISQCAKLPKVGCLALRAPKLHPAPLRAISTAFPRLITLTINNKSLVAYHPRENDRLILPDLEILELDLSVFKSGTFETWSLPTLIHLSTPASRRGDLTRGPQTVLEPARILGANLLFLNIYRTDAPINIPLEFWSWCPRLVEFLAFLSWVCFDTPIPIDHPLKYIVHWPHYDGVDDLWAPSSVRTGMPLVLRNLMVLPAGLKQFIIWRSWSEYLNSLVARYNTEERHEILVRMNEICSDRGIHIEDQEKVTLGDYLAGTSEETVDQSVT